MDSAVEHGHKAMVNSHTSDWQEPYKPLPFLYLGLLIVWTVLVAIWTLNTWSKRQWQTSNLQWVLTSVPVLKVLVLGLSFLFW
jgi:ribose/xylose/arabinose/galactoside ABC-type transport system permease subunit